MSRPHSSLRGRAGCGVLPDDLDDYARMPAPRLGRPPRQDLERWIVTDDWPDRVPVLKAEIDLFEAWFGDLFDELLGPRR